MVTILLLILQSGILGGGVISVGRFSLESCSEGVALIVMAVLQSDLGS